jgi:1,4-alpha-glucan branching enzyme
MAREAAAPRKQTFHYKAPTATSVLLVGEFTRWQEKAIAMHKGQDGTWSVSVALPPGTHPYRFIVDGQWCDDPQCTLRVPNPYGTENMVRQVA